MKIRRLEEEKLGSSKKNLIKFVLAQIIPFISILYRFGQAEQKKDEKIL